MPAPARVLGYVRVSSDGQERDGTSLDAQRERIAAWCRERGWPAPDLRVEVESAGEEKIEKRTELHRLIADTRPGDVVVVAMLDRWSRDIVFGVGSIRRLVRAGVPWHAIHEQIDASTAHGDEQLGLRMWIAESERRRIKARTDGARQRLREQGLWATGHVPFGYRRAGSREERRHLYLEPHPDEAPLVVAAYHAAAEGVSLRDLAARLRAASPRGPSWTGVHRLIRSRTYLGEILIRGEWRRGAHPALVDRATWERAQYALRDRGKGREARGRFTRDALLAGVLRCGICGRRCSVAVAPKGERYYVCAARRKPADYAGETCAGPYARAEPLERDTEAAILARLAGLREQLDAAVPAPPRGEDLAGKRARLEERLARAVRLAVDGAISAEELRRQRARLDADLGDLARREHEAAAAEAARDPAAREALARGLASLAAAWEHATVEDRRAALRLLAARVELAPDRRLRWTWWTAEELASPT